MQITAQMAIKQDRKSYIDYYDEHYSLLVKSYFEDQDLKSVENMLKQYKIDYAIFAERLGVLKDIITLMKAQKLKTNPTTEHIKNKTQMGLYLKRGELL